jgi:hypothetical protein
MYLNGVPLKLVGFIVHSSGVLVSFSIYQDLVCI